MWLIHSVILISDEVFSFYETMCRNSQVNVRGYATRVNGIFDMDI